MSTPPRKIEILGTPVAAVDYDSATEESKRLAKCGRAAAVSASNTHIIALARYKPDFGRVMREFDLVLPDGMPLRWALNAKGANSAPVSVPATRKITYGSVEVTYTGIERVNPPERGSF